MTLEIKPFDFTPLKAALEAQGIGACALALAQITQQDMPCERYLNHLKKLKDLVQTRYLILIDAGAEDDVFTQLAALKDTLAQDQGYSVKADDSEANPIENASLMRLVDRGCGDAWVLGLLYIICARAQGWQADILAFPELCVCALQAGGKKALFFPSSDVSLLQAADLRRSLKRELGTHAELSAAYFEPLPDSALLIRLQNKVKFKQIEMEDYAGALLSVQAMQLIDPDEYRLLLDAGVLYVRLRKKEQAIEALEAYLKRAPEGRDWQEAALLLHDLQNMS